MTDRNELPDLPYELRGAIQAYANRSARFDYVVETIRSYGLQCYRMGVEAERERCIEAVQSAGPKDGPLKLITDGFAAAIRGTDTE